MAEEVFIYSMHYRATTPAFGLKTFTRNDMDASGYNTPVKNWSSSNRNNQKTIRPGVLLFHG